MVDSFRVPSFRWVAFVLVPFAVAELRAQSVGSERPTITMKGGEDVAAALSDLRKLHEPGTGPKSTLWDAWLVTPSLWPATPRRDQKRDAWREVLLGRKMSSDGYVATHQHPSIAHPEGWPFPFWNQGLKGFGRHYSFAETVGPPWRQGHLDRPQPKMLTGAEDRGVADLGWRIAPTSPRASIRLDISGVAAIEAPFLQIRWSSKGAVFGRPHIAWRRADEAAARSFVGQNGESTIPAGSGLNLGVRHGALTNAGCAAIVDGIRLVTRDLLVMKMSVPNGPGSLRLVSRLARPQGLVSRAITVGTLPPTPGWFFGFNITTGKIRAQLDAGYPFVVQSDSTEYSAFEILTGVVPGIPLGGVAIEFSGSIPPIRMSLPVDFITQ